jgi:Fe2+ transport protein
VDGFSRHARWLVPVAAAALLTAACGSSGESVTTVAPGSTVSGSASAMPGMAMSSGQATQSKAMSVDGIKPIPTRTLAAATWQGMKITARETTAAPFVIYDGSREQMVKPGRRTSFHLVVMLSDAQTGVAIPYASVWATIRKAGKIVYDERQWPMISRYMGPHYGNNVTLPGAGTYQLGLLVSPPVSARHIEYQKVWLKPHRVTLSFRWSPSS